MAMADDVRAYAFEHYVKLARSRGEPSVKIRAGDIHTALKYRNRLPLVCAALGAMKFREAHGLTLQSIDGPGQSSTTTFTFALK